MRVLGVIPARYHSSRYPGKPLVDLLGKSMIQRVYEKVSQSEIIDETWVATDHEQIFEHCQKYGMRVCMSSPDCLTGTDRVCEVGLKSDAELIVNVQGDEPLIRSQDVDKVIRFALGSSAQVVNAMKRIEDPEEFHSLNVPKVVVDGRNRLLYMSRSPIPVSKENRFQSAFKQVCIYAFRRSALELFRSQGKKTPLEKIEDIEILRFVESGMAVSMLELDTESCAIDIPADRDKVLSILKREELRC